MDEVVTDFSVAGLIGEFEKAFEQEERIAALNSQIKMLKKDNNDAFAEYAKSHGMKPKHIKEAYKHWKSAKDADDPSNVDDALYDILAKIDLYLENEKAE